MMRRRAISIALLLNALGLPLATRGQTQPKVRRIGFLVMRSPPTAENPDYYVAFVDRLRQLGYVERKNLHIEWRGAQGKSEQLPRLAAELVASNLEVIVTHSTQGVAALQQATRTLPIVTATVTDPVASGFAASLAKPGGNITGLSLVHVDLSPKYIEFLKAVVPGMSRVAVLVNPDNSSHASIVKGLQSAAEQVKMKIVVVEARGTAAELEHAFLTIDKDRLPALIVVSDAFFIAQRRRITNLLAKYRIPSIFAYREDAEAGALMSYGQDTAEFYRRAADYVEKILKGAKPSDLPFEQPAKFDFVINLKTAKALRVTIPQELILRADTLIE